MIKLHLQFHPSDRGIDPKSTAKVLKILNKRFGSQADGTLSVKVTSDSEIKQLNRRYADKNETTDVLSFSYLEQPGPQANGELGDIVISRQRLTAQAKTAGTNRATELALLIIHGTLHILGYDHQNPSQRRQLDRLQSQIMEEAGLVYRDFDWQKA